MLLYAFVHCVQRKRFQKLGWIKDLMLKHVGTSSKAHLCCPHEISRRLTTQEVTTNAKNTEDCLGFAHEHHVTVTRPSCCIFLPPKSQRMSESFLLNALTRLLIRIHLQQSAADLFERQFSICIFVLRPIGIHWHYHFISIAFLSVKGLDPWPTAPSIKATKKAINLVQELHWDLKSAPKEVRSWLFLCRNSW